MQVHRNIGWVWIALVGLFFVAWGCNEESSSQASAVVKKAPVSPGGPRMAAVPEEPPAVKRSSTSQKTGGSSSANAEKPAASKAGEPQTAKRENPPQSRTQPKDQGMIAMKKEPEYIYRPGDRRDPFQPFFLEAREGEVLPECKGVPRGPLTEKASTQFSLVAIVKRGKERVAMVQDREGKGYVLRENTYVGKKCGQVARIGPEGVIIEEPYRDLLGEKKMRKVVLDFNVAGGGGR